MAASSAARGGAVLHAHRHEPEGVVAHLHDGVHRGRREAVEVLGERGLAEGQRRRAGRQVVGQQLGPSGQRRGGREAAVADHLGGHALADLALRAGIEGQGEVGMRVDVDEAGRHDLAARVDRPARRAPGARLEGGDAPVAHRHVGLLPGRTRAVEDQSSADDDVVHARPARRCSRNGRASASGDARAVARGGVPRGSQPSLLPDGAAGHRGTALRRDRSTLAAPQEPDGISRSAPGIPGRDERGGHGGPGRGPPFHWRSAPGIPGRDERGGHGGPRPRPPISPEEAL